MGDTYWNGYVDQKEIILADLDSRSIRLFGPQTMKVMCDTTGFAAMMKYGGTRMIHGRIIVTSNYSPSELFYMKQVEDMFTLVDQTAILRRFKVQCISRFLFEQGMKLKTPAELKQLSRDQNCDLRTCFEFNE